LGCIRILGKGSGWAWEKGAGFPLHPSLGSSHLFVHKVRRAHIQSMVVTHYVNIALLLDNQLTATCFHCINKQSIFVHLSIRPIPHRHQASHNRIDPNVDSISLLLSHPHSTMRTKVAQVLPLARLSGNHPSWMTKQRTAPSFNPTQSSLKSYHVTVVPSATRKPGIFFPLVYNKAAVLGRFFLLLPLFSVSYFFPPFPMPLSQLPFLFAWLWFIAFSDSHSTCLCTILYQNCFALDNYPQGKQIFYVK